MATKIDKILAKKKWTGAEVGQALLASVNYDALHIGEAHETLFPQETFTKMESTLSTEYDLAVYGVYRSLYHAILDSYNRGNGLYQQFYNGFSRYSSVFHLCFQNDKALKEIETSTPLIMTEAEYNEHREKLETLRKARKESFITILFNLLEDFIEERAEAPKNIAELIEATANEKATNQRILKNYIKDVGRGYYQLPDGTRSDKLHKKEWRQALLEFKTKDCSSEEAEKNDKDEVLNAYKLLYYGIDSIKELYKEKYGSDLKIEPEEEQELLETLDFYFSKAINDRDDKRLENGIAPLYMHEYEEIYSIRSLINSNLRGIEWHYYETPPAFTKHDILYTCLYFYTTGEKEHYSEFKEDYPALFSALEAYIKEQAEPLRGYNSTQYYEKVITWEELITLGVGTYNEQLSKDLDVQELETLLEEEKLLTPEKRFYYYKKRQRAKNGIAILKNPKKKANNSPYYIERFNPLIFFTSLDEVSESKEIQEELVAYQEQLLKPALRFLYSHNTIMDILEKIYDLEDLSGLKLSTEYFEYKINNFNDMIYLFYGEVYGNKEERTRKRKIIKEHFPLIDIEELKPTGDAITEVEKLLIDYGFTTKAHKELTNFDRLVAILSGEGA